MCVFRRDLKFSSDDAFLISAGNLFHKVGAAILDTRHWHLTLLLHFLRRIIALSCAYSASHHTHIHDVLQHASTDKIL